MTAIIWRCKNKNEAQASISHTDTAEVKLLPIYLVDSIEHFFGNENWQSINGTDTSYLLFSRQNPTTVKVYHYKIVNGDSVNNTESWIRLAGDSVQWSQPGQTWTLQINNNHLHWIAGNDSIVVQRLGPNKLSYQQGGEVFRLHKTMTLSDFLLRTRYDYLHGTHYAFDSSIKFTVKKDKERKLINIK